MSTDEAHRLLVCGDVKGKITSLTTRISKIMRLSEKFDFLFCIGDFFGTDLKEIELLVSGQLSISLPTFVVSPLTESSKKFVENEQGCEMCENVTYLGTKGTYNSMGGLRIVYFADIDEGSGTSQLPSSLLCEAVAAEDLGFMGVDILITCQWPSGIERQTNFKIPDECQICIKSSSSLISRLAYLIRPRYHFVSGSGVYYERPPYRNHRVLQEKACHTTRFIALANVKNPTNQKYIYALKLIPIDKMDRRDLINQPLDVTENPYLGFIEHETVSDSKETDVQTDQYFYDFTERQSPNKSRKRRHANNNADSTKHESKIKSKRETFEEKLNKPRDQAACWFCLGNPQVKKHLVVSVSTQAYLAMPRGPLVPDHVLILTVGHHQNWITCPDYVRSEIEDYKARLKRMFASQGKAMVAYERNLKTQHYQLQVVPVPLKVAADVKQVFLDLAAHYDSSPCELKQIPRNTEIDQICAPGIPYFYVELPNGEKLFSKIPKDRLSTTDLQFGRLVLTDPRILDCPDKADWRDCTDDEDMEAELTNKLRALFSPYDIE